MFRVIAALTVVVSMGCAQSPDPGTDGGSRPTPGSDGAAGLADGAVPGGSDGAGPRGDATSTADGGPNGADGATSRPDGASGDASVPNPITVAETVPPSPANDNRPLVTGRGAPANAAVGIFGDPSCSTLLARTRADPDGVFSRRIEVSDDTTTPLHAAVVEDDSDVLVSPCSTVALVYVEDSTAPDLPDNLRVTPAPVANDNAPRILGDVEPEATVDVFAEPTCTASVAISGAAATFTSTGLQVSVTDNSTTTWHARATDRAGNTSGCSTSSVTYTEDSAPPPAPTGLAVSPTPPDPSLTLRVTGRTEPGNTISVHRDPLCQAAAEGSGTAAAFGGSGIGVSVPPDSVTTFYARAFDAANNGSACSTDSAQYVHNFPPRITNLPSGVTCPEATNLSFATTATDTATQVASINFSEGPGSTCAFPHTVSVRGIVNGTCMVPGVCTIVVRAGDGTLTSTSALVVNVLPVPGTVDTRFGGGRGFVTRGAVGRAAVGTDMVIDASGRLVVAGALVRAGVATDEDLAIWRLMPDGTTDTTFAGGRVTHHGAAGGVGDDRAWGVAVDPVGNVVAAGESCRGGGPCGPADIDIAVWRYRDNGTLDTTFSGDGIYTANPSGDFDTANDVSVSTIGGQTRITVVGNGFFNSAAEPNIVALRLDNAGALDRTFDGDGILSFDELGAESALAAHGVFDANERKLLVAGSIEIISGDREMFFWRFRQNGAKDNTFGTRCMIDTDIADNVGCWTSAVQRDDVAQDITTDGMGRVVVVGVTQTNTGAFDMIVWRTSAAGVPDTTFGVGGAWWRVFDFGPDDSAEAVTVDAMGRIVIVGFSRSPRGDDDLLVMRLLPSGAVDPAFGVNGILRHDRGAGDERGFAVTIDGQGRILVAGRSRSLAGDDEMTIWRINP